MDKRTNRKVAVKSWLFLSIALIGIFAFLTFRILAQPPVNSSTRISHIGKPFETSFYDRAYQLAKDYKKDPSSERVIGGIIPHHLLVSPLIAAFFEGLSKQKIKKVILIGPNHFNLDDPRISVSEGVWKTVYGDLNPDTAVIDKLKTSKVITVNEKVFDTEHSIFGITTFIKRSLPDASIIPIIFKSYTKKEECDQIANLLNQVIDDETLIVASVDFSHYLTSDEADKFDQESLAAIQSFDLKKIFELDGTKNFDSPASIYTLLKVMQFKSSTSPILLQHTNSAKYSNQPDLKKTTSYFTMYFTKPGKINSLDLNTIFNNDHSWVSTLPKERVRTMIATGDVIPARSVNSQVLKHRDFKWPYLKTSDKTQAADITFINLESPLINNCPATQEGLIFCSDARNIDGLTFAGVDVVNLANNHSGNYGLAAINYTASLLKNNGILVTGQNGAVYKNVRGMRFAFLGYNNIGYKQAGISWADEARIQSDIAEARKNSDIVIITYHWGAEYKDQPDERQKYLGRFAIDAGADLVIGNHPHWIQPVEVYKDKLIAYAHGNFVSDQQWSLKTKQGVIGKYTFYDERLIDVEYLPVQIENFGQPYFLTGDKKNVILDEMKKQSLKLAVSPQ